MVKGSFFPFFFLPHPPTSPLNLFNCELSSVCKTTHRNHTFKQQQQANKQKKKTKYNKPHNQGEPESRGDKSSKTHQ